MKQPTNNTSLTNQAATTQAGAAQVSDYGRWESGLVAPAVASETCHLELACRRGLADILQVIVAESIVSSSTIKRWGKKLT